MSKKIEEPVDIPTEVKVVVSNHIPKMEKVMFYNLRDPGASVHFHVHTPTHPLKHYDLLHGFTYSLPEEVCLHLEGQGICENSCHSPEYGVRKNAQDQNENYIKSFKPYFQLKRLRA